jgi:hypothetical protein
MLSISDLNLVMRIFGCKCTALTYTFYLKDGISLLQLPKHQWRVGIRQFPLQQVWQFSLLLQLFNHHFCSGPMCFNMLILLQLCLCTYNFPPIILVCSSFHCLHVVCNHSWFCVIFILVLLPLNYFLPNSIVVMFLGWLLSFHLIVMHFIV